MKSKALEAFQSVCHEYYTCYAFACLGMQQVASSMKLEPDKYPNQRLFVSHRSPDAGHAQSVMNAAKAVQYSQRDGLFPDALAKAFITRMYADWDELYRHEIAREFSAAASWVKADLMGDLRRVRHWIVHGKSRVESDLGKILVLPWQLKDGVELHITSVMFRELADCLNCMQAHISPLTLSESDR